VLAGFGIAIPVGPIAVLLIDTGIRRGFRIASAAALGVASADLTYATIAALAGLAVAEALEPWTTTVRLVSGGVLLALAAYRTYDLVRKRNRRTPSRPDRGLASTYGGFLALTLFNPATIAYFAALIIGLSQGATSGVTDKFLFVAGAFAASASWQLVLVAVASVLHRRLTAPAQLLTAMLGNAVIFALAIRLLL
jgi:arginine exporter protein ArgO